MKKILKNKKILITSGPVWVPIDKVRIMTNIFGGTLGYVMASEAVKLGAEVLLLMGPGRVHFTGNESFKFKKFKFFDDIYNLLDKEISKKKYDVIIHSAAIPDYIPIKIYDGKIKSGSNNLVINFKPTFKIVDKIKEWDPNIFLVKFKLEVDKNKKDLIEVAYKSMIFSKADLIIANELRGIQKKHKAYIIDKNKNIIECVTKNDIAKKLFKLISENI